MTLQAHIKRGKAILTPDGLRCQAPRLKDPSHKCNKLQVRRNSANQLAGAFKCERCSQEIEVELVAK
jgi:hypothetical protein